MRLLIVLTVCVFLIGCAGDPKHPAWANATGAEQHERLIWKAVQEKDWSGVERHLTSTFIGVTAEGRSLDRSGWVDYWKGAPNGEFSIGEIVVQPEGPDMKVTYILQMQAAPGHAAGPDGLRVVSIWQDIKTRWMLTATSLTPIQNQ